MIASHPEAGTERVARIVGEPGRLAFVARISMIELISVAGIKQRTGSLTAAGAAVFLRQVTVSAVMGDFVIQQMHADDYET